MSLGISQGGWALRLSLPETFRGGGVTSHLGLTVFKVEHSSMTVGFAPEREDIHHLSQGSFQGGGLASTPGLDCSQGRGARCPRDSEVEPGPSLWGCPGEDGCLGRRSQGPSGEEERPQLPGWIVFEGGVHAFDSLNYDPPKERGA